MMWYIEIGRVKYEFYTTSLQNLISILKYMIRRCDMLRFEE